MAYEDGDKDAQKRSNDLVVRLRSQAAATNNPEAKLELLNRIRDLLEVSAELALAPALPPGHTLTGEAQRDPPSSRRVERRQHGAARDTNRYYRPKRSRSPDSHHRRRSPSPVSRRRRRSPSPVPHRRRRSPSPASRRLQRSPSPMLHRRRRSRSPGSYRGSWSPVSRHRRQRSAYESDEASRHQDGRSRSRSPRPPRRNQHARHSRSAQRQTSPSSRPTSQPVPRGSRPITPHLTINEVAEGSVHSVRQWDGLKSSLREQAHWQRVERDAELIRRDAAQRNRQSHNLLFTPTEGCRPRRRRANDGRLSPPEFDNDEDEGGLVTAAKKKDNEEDHRQV